MFYLAGSLKTSRLKYVILDWTWRDQKLRRMIDIPEVGRSTQKLVKNLATGGGGGGGENFSLNISPSLGEGGGEEIRENLTARLLLHVTRGTLCSLFNIKNSDAL